MPTIGVTMSVDESGELLARTNQVSAGYWEQPEETAKALDGGWFHTGDGGTIDEQPASASARVISRSGLSPGETLRKSLRM